MLKSLARRRANAIDLVTLIIALSVNGWWWIPVAVIGAAVSVIVEEIAG